MRMLARRPQGLTEPTAQKKRRDKKSIKWRVLLRQDL
jgi:hypothetical protein